MTERKSGLWVALLGLGVLLVGYITMQAIPRERGHNGTIAGKAAIVKELDLSDLRPSAGPR